MVLMRDPPLHTRDGDAAPSGPTSAACGAGSRSSSRRPRPGPPRESCPRRRRAACRERAAFTVEAVEERERTTGHDVAAFVDVVADSIGEEGRWIHYGLTSSDVLDTALALQLREAGAIVVGGAREPTATRSSIARSSTARRSASGAPTGSTPSRPPSACGSPASPSRRTATCAASSDAFEQVRGRQALGRRRHLRLGPAGDRGAGDGRARPAGRGHLHPGRPARPPRRASSARSRSPARGSSASRPRCATSSAPRSARSRSRSAPGRRALRRCPTSATRSSPSGSRGLARVLRGYAQAGLENVALWHERDISHSGAERVVLPDATILLDYMQHLAHAARRRDDGPRGADAREPGPHPRRALQPAGAHRARRIRA